LLFYITTIVNHDEKFALDSNFWKEEIGKVILALKLTKSPVEEGLTA
jgi:hypothetical protein